MALMYASQPEEKRQVAAPLKRARARDKY